LLVRVTNKMSAPCSLIGYPGLETDDAPAKSKLTRALRDASFGTTNATPPIIVLAPGGSATAGVEWALSSVPPAAASCAGSARFSLPNGSVVQPVPVPLACTPVTVYPFISGFSGKD
jgi:hypothetical protein